MSELLHSLGINWPVMVAQLVNFAILLFLLARFVYTPVMRLLDERREGIAQAARREAESAEKLAGLEKEREKILVAARAESQKIIDEAKKSGEQIAQRTILSAQEEIARREREAEKRFADDKARLVAEARREIGTLVVDAIERSLGDALDARSQGRMVEQALAAIRDVDKKTS